MFDRSSSAGNKIFRSETHLTNEFTPETHPGRETEIQRIADTLHPLTKRKPPEHLLVYGPSGTGKTSCVKKVLNQIEQETTTKTAYINCWQYNTRPSLHTELLRQLGYPIPRKGKPVDRLVAKLREWLDKYHNVAVCLDEIDQLQARTEVIYDLCLASEEAENYFGLVMISNKDPIQLEIDPRSHSRLNFRTVKFESYTADQLIEILEKRIEHAFQPGTVSEEVPQAIAEKIAEENGDCRQTLNLLLQAGRQASENEERKVTSESIREK